MGVCLALSVVLLALPGETMLIDRKDLRRVSLMIVSVISRGEGRELW